MDTTCTIQDSIHVFSLVYKYVSRILGTYQSGGGQILVCVAGRGYYQEEGKEAVEMKPGDCINIPAEVKHWHGAAPDEWFSHRCV